MRGGFIFASFLLYIKRSFNEWVIHLYEYGPNSTALKGSYRDSRMAHNQDAQVIDALEEQLLRYDISFDRLRRHLAKFSLELIFKRKLGTISAENLHAITLALSEAMTRESIDREDTFVKQIITLLCAIEAQCGTSSSETYIMAKCSLFCFGTLDGWVEEDSGDSTPIYLYFVILKKIFPDVRQDFVRFFQELLNE